MGIRLLIVALPLLLSGCASMPSLSWSSLSPFNWFGSTLEMRADGIGGIDATTPMQQEAIDQGLAGQYRLRSGMGIEGERMTRFYQAMADGQVILTLRGETRVEQITLDSATIATAWGTRVGMPFSALYASAYEGECQRVPASEGVTVQCQAPQSKRVSYRFHGQWNGPAGLMPPNDVLSAWPVSQIIWRADAV
ncbi:MAG: RpoE-regulated lipoprotein [Edwardsiella tarda]